MKISEILEKKDGKIYGVQEDTRLCDVIDELNSKNVGALIVYDSKGGVAGIVSERDIVKKSCSRGKNTEEIPVSQIMTPREKLIVGTPDDTISYAMNVMITKRVRHLPVFSGDKLSGIISIRDIIEIILSQSEEEIRLLKEHIRNPYGINAL